MRCRINVALITVGLLICVHAVWARKQKDGKALASGSVRFTIPRQGRTENAPEVFGLKAAKRTRSKKHQEHASVRDLVPETITIVKKEESIKASALPGATGEDVEVSDEKENKRRKKLRAQIHKQSENAAMLGNNEALKPGMNPATASISPDLDHEAIAGPAFAVDQDKKVWKHHKGRHKTNSVEESQDDDTLVKQIEDIAHQLDDDSKPKHGSQMNAVTEHESKATNTSFTSVDPSSDSLPSSSDDDDDEESSSSGSGANIPDVHSVLSADAKHGDSSAWPDGEDDVDVKLHTSKVTHGKPAMALVNQLSPKAFKNTSEVASRGDAGGPEGFECPWVCFWTCHSYCPKECCYNPFHCDTVCRTFCAPTCHDRCCAPGSHRLPNLQLNFQPNTPAPIIEDNLLSMARAEVANFNGDLPGTNPIPSYMESVKAAHEREMEVRRLEELHKTSELVARMSGYPLNCPLFCSRICTPGLCDKRCCNLKLVVQHVEDPQVLPAPADPAQSHLPAQTVSTETSVTHGQPAPAEPVQVISSPSKYLPGPSSSLPLQASFMEEVQRAWQTAHNAGALRSAAESKLTPVANSNAAALPVERIASDVSPPLTPSTGTHLSQNIDPESMAALVGIPSVVQDAALTSTNGAAPLSIPPAVPYVDKAVQDFPDSSARSIDVHAGEQPPNAVAPSLEARHLLLSDTVAGSTLSNLQPMESATINRSTNENFCPPICRTSCIDECPNQCCSNAGGLVKKNA